MRNEFLLLAKRVADLERRVSGGLRYGRVDSVDPAGGTVRVVLASGPDGDVISGPIPYAQTAGAVKVHSPPSVGQQMMIMSPGGDVRQAVAMPMTFSDAEASPGAAEDTHILTFGDLALTMEGGSLVLTIAGMTAAFAAGQITFTVGGVATTISASGLSVDGGQVRHNGTDIGSTHAHSGVNRGGSNTDAPI
jgi:phage baseplate assembly protein V